MRSHLVALLIAGLVLMPAVRLTPLGMPVGETRSMCAECRGDADAGEPAACCSSAQETHGAPSDDHPCDDCPPARCLIGPALALKAPDANVWRLTTPSRAAPERPRDERAPSRALAPDPPVPIA